MLLQIITRHRTLYRQVKEFNMCIKCQFRLESETEKEYSAINIGAAWPYPSTTVAPYTSEEQYALVCTQRGLSFAQIVTKNAPTPNILPPVLAQREVTPRERILNAARQQRQGKLGRNRKLQLRNFQVEERIRATDVRRILTEALPSGRSSPLNFLVDEWLNC